MTNIPSAVDVLIVGGGPVGVGLAIELSLFGIKSTVVERHLSPLELPRGQLLNPRSMEIFQRWGIAEEIDQATLLPKDFPTAFVFCNSLNGSTYAYLPLNNHKNLHQMTPQHFQRLPLWLTETILRKRVALSGCIDLQLGWTVTSVKEEQDCVKAIVAKKDGSAQKEVRAQYVIGCDGAASMVRTTSQIPFEGDQALSQVQQIIFEAPLTQLINIKIGSFYYVFGKNMFGGIGAIDGKSLWVAQIPTFSDKPLDQADLAELLKELTGIDTSFTIIRSHAWELGSQVAQSFHAGRRLFLAGDAAHRLSPTGGHGLNVGLGDTVNLGWKLAATLQGWGGGQLLASYSKERKAVASQVENNSKTNFLRVKAIRENYPPDIYPQDFEQAILKMAHQYDALGLTMGYRYSQSPIVIHDAFSDEPNFDDIVYTPSAYPGHMAPYAVLNDGSNLYEHLGVGFSLLCFKDHDVECIKRYAQQRGVPLTIVRITDENIRDHYAANFVLIRPDRHVAWRGDGLSNQLDQWFDVVLGFI